MLARSLFVLALFAVLTLLAAATTGQYESNSFKGPEGVKTTETYEFYLYDGQCTGVVRVQSELPPSCREPVALSGYILDYAKFPEVYIENELTQVTFKRQPNPRTNRCDDRARIEVHANCVQSNSVRRLLDHLRLDLL